MPQATSPPSLLVTTTAKPVVAISLNCPLSSDPSTYQANVVGSLLNGQFQEIATTGSAVVGTNSEGGLVAWGKGVPPRWIKDAAGAEAWALAKVLSFCPVPPNVFTDCQALSHEAQSTPQRMRGPNKALARVLKFVLDSLDGNLAPIADASRLVWIPAHQATGAIGNRVRSGR